MADPHLLKLIGKGMSAWNQWRRTKKTDVFLDLSGVYFSGLDLRQMNLSRSNLEKANISLANLSKANLGCVFLDEADLSQADLSGADLSEASLKLAYVKLANFSNANLTKANLSKADLYNANLSGADLSEANLFQTNLEKANLSLANLTRAKLINANLEWASLFQANLEKADLRDADLYNANLSGVNLSGADLSGADLRKTDLSGRADLSGANLSHAVLIKTNLENAILTGAKVYGISVWDVNLRDADQTSLVITPDEQPVITVDNLEVAQFIYLLLKNSKIRDVINTITSKAVLILGRFTPERKVTLDALREALRSHNYLPILFDFEKPSNRDFTETVSTLAHLARFVIADLTDPRSIPQELTAIIPHLLSVPVRPVLLGSQSEWAMFSDLKRYPQVIPPLHYTNDAMLLSLLESDVIAPAEQKARELSTK